MIRNLLLPSILFVFVLSPTQAVACYSNDCCEQYRMQWAFCSWNNPLIPADPSCTDDTYNTGEPTGVLHSYVEWVPYACSIVHTAPPESGCAPIFGLGLYSCCSGGGTKPYACLNSPSKAAIPNPRIDGTNGSKDFLALLNIADSPLNPQKTDPPPETLVVFPRCTGGACLPVWLL